MFIHTCTFAHVSMLDVHVSMLDVHVSMLDVHVPMLDMHVPMYPCWTCMYEILQLIDRNNCLSHELCTSACNVVSGVVNCRAFSPHSCPPKLQTRTDRFFFFNTQSHMSSEKYTDICETMCEVVFFFFFSETNGLEVLFVLRDL